MLDEDLSEAKALLKVIVSAAYADGKLTPQEEDAFLAKLGRIRGLTGKSEEQLQELVDELFEEIDQLNVDGLIDEAASYFIRNPDLAESAYAHALDVVAADGIINDREEVMIKKLGHSLQIDEARMKEIRNVILAMAQVYYDVPAT